MNAGWGMAPTLSTNLSGTLWASRYIAERDTEGVTTVSVSTPFRSYNFNGLVTFTNLNQELSGNSASSRITTIDGGLITTGELDADQVTIRKLSASAGINGERTEVSQDGVKVYSAGNNGDGVLRVKLGDLS